MTIQNLFKSLRNGRVASVYLILGHQEYLSRLIQRRFTALIPSNERTMNLARYDLNQTGLGTVLNDATSAPFLGKWRLIFVENPLFLTGNYSARSSQNNSQGQRRLKQFVNYLKRPLSSTILVILAPYPKLDRRKKITRQLYQSARLIDLSRLTEFQVKSYVQQVINRHRFSITRDNLNLLIQRTGGQLSVVMSELPKLLLYCRQSKQITRAAIDSLITKSLNQNVFDLVRDVLKGQVTKAVDLNRQLIQMGQEPLQINAILVSQFRLLLQAMILSRQGYSQGSLAQILRVHPYRVKLALMTIRYFTLGQLINDYLNLVKTEIKMKSTNQSPELLFEMLMIKLAAKKNDRIN